MSFRRIPWVGFWCLLLVCRLAADEPPVPRPARPDESGRPDERRLQKHVSTLASAEFEGRGTVAGKQRAMDYIIAEFRALELQPLFPEGEFQQPIPGPKSGGRETIVGRNLGAWLPGADPRRRDEFIIISAHYDHLGIRNGRTYPGADDNASSVSLMLELARIFSQSKTPPPCSLVFLSCDLEENLLWGSRWFVAHPPWPLEKVRLFVTAELIGRTLGDLPLPTVFVMGGEHTVGMRELVDSVPCPAPLRVSHLGIDIVGVRSDYGPFQAEKIPCLFFSGGEHRDYHQPTDTAEKLDYHRIAQVTELVQGVVTQVASLDRPPEWSAEPRHTLAEVRSIHEVCDLLLRLDEPGRAPGRKRLTQQEQFTLSNIRRTTGQILDRGEVDPAARPWLVRSAQWMLLTLF